MLILERKGDLRSDVVDYHGDSEAMLASQDMLQKCRFASALDYCKSRL